jgi:ABC-type dipeptide/oligopeptide/nickel transport system ATPase component
LTDIPRGCAFHPRCPYFVEGPCNGEVPNLAAVSGFAQTVACTPLQQGLPLILSGQIDVR